MKSKTEIVRSLSDAKNYVTKMQKISCCKNPVFIIGLGGQGGSALVTIKSHLIEYMGLEDGKVPDNVEILEIDSDKTIENLSKDGVGFAKDEVFIVQKNLKYILSYYDALSPEIKSYLNPATTFSSPPGSGCAGNRVASKTMLFDEIGQSGSNNLIAILESKIHKVCTGNSLPPMVILAGGVGGGTCSGMFFDVAYLIRAMLNNILGENNKATFYGYLFTPDLLAVDATIKKHTYANAAAFFQEACYLQSLPDLNEKYCQKYTSTYEINTNQAPVDFFHIESGTDINGMLVPDAQNHCLDVVAQSVVSYLSEEKLNSSDTNSALSSHYSNVDTYNKTISSTDPYGKPCNIVSLGSANLVLPTGELSKMIALEVFREMEKFYSNEPNAKDIAEVISALKIEIDEQTNLYLEQINGYRPHKEDFSYDEVCKYHTLDAKEYMSSRFIRQVSNDIPAIAKRLLGKFEQDVDALFSNYSRQLNKGFVFISRLMVNTKEFTIIDAMENYRSSLDEDLQALEYDADVLERQANIAYHNAEKAFLDKSRRKDEYIELLLKWADKKVEGAIKQSLKLQYQNYIDYLLNKNTNIYNVVTSSLEILKQIFEENEVAKTETHEKVSNHNREYVWEILDVNLLKSAIHKELENTVDVKEMSSEFMQALNDKLDLWVGEDADVMRFVREFIQDKFENMLSISLEKCIEQEAMVKKGLAKEYDLYGPQAMSQDELMEYIETEIIPKLLEQAHPLFQIKTAGSASATTAIYISVPEDSACSIISEAFKGLAKNNKGYVIKHSSANDRITVVNCTCGIPLYRWVPINEMIKAYEEYLPSVVANGRHLCATESNDWSQLPPAYPYKAWVIDDFKSKYIMKQTNERKEVMKAALETGVIFTQVNSSDQVGYYIRKTKPLQTEASNTIDKMDSMEILTNKIVESESLLSSGLETETDLVGKPIIKEFKGAKDEESLEKTFMNSYQLYYLTVAEVKKRKALIEMIDRLKERAKEIRNAGNVYRQFMKLLYTATVTVKPNTTVFVFNSEEEKGDALELLDKRSVGKYAEYELYKVLKTHPLLEDMEANADRKDKYLSGKADELKSNMKQILADIKRKCMDAKLDECLSTEGKECNLFYQGCKKVLEEELAFLE